MQVWKFTLDHGENQLTLPIGAQPLKVMSQKGHPRIWFRINENAQLFETRRFYLLGAGHTFATVGCPDAAPYIGTCLTHDVRLVWHVFEGAPAAPAILSHGPMQLDHAGADPSFGREPSTC